MSANWDHKKKWKEGMEIQEAIVLSSSYRTNQKMPNYSNQKIGCGGETSTSFNYVLPHPLIGVTSMKISSLEVPVDVYFTISDYYGNNIFTIGDLTFTIPDGNYTSNQEIVDIINLVIKEKYQTLGEKSVLGTKTIVNGSDIYDISYNTPSECAIYATYKDMFIYFVNINYLVDITDITGFDNNVLLSFSNVDSDPNFTYTLGWILGFRTYEYNLITIVPTSILVTANSNPNNISLSQDISGIYIYSAPNSNPDELAYYVRNEVPANFTPTKSFLISVEDFQSNGMDNIKVGFNNSFLNKRILARIPFIKTKDINNTFIYNKYNDTPVNIRQYRGPTDISKLKIELLDDLGRVINLFGADWNFVLTVTRTVDQSINGI
jgi:hypothetical protein